MSIATLTTSWDDGVPEDERLGELLASYGFPGTFYATTGPIGHRLISDAATSRLVALGHELGNHGRTHRPFTALSAEELLDELAWGEREIGAVATSHRLVAPPAGIVSKAVRATLRANRYVLRSAPILAKSAATRELVVPSAQMYPHSVFATYKHLAKHRLLPPLAFLRAWSRGGTPRERFRRLADIAHRRGLVLHVWGHSAELERFQLWGDLEAFLEEARELGFRGATNSQLLA
jgi:peptidoglycan/xylan/chitin deacetylase (PgdA/CDA1 family)